MDSDSDAVCERIINDISGILEKHSELCHFEIVHVASTQNKNKSPVLHMENNLGLESWCVQHVYKYAHQKLLVPGSNSNAISKCATAQSIIKYLNVAILINSDVATFWNMRRKLFVKNQLNITKEFQFSTIVLSKKPKSNEAFFYRRWLFSFQSGESIDWTFELGLCERCADKNTSNYHAWTHRQWVLQKVPYLLKHELRITEKFIRKHIADYSAYNHRQHVLLKLFEHGHGINETEYNSLNEFIEKHFQTTNNLKTISMNCSRLDDNCLRNVLYCLNNAMYDLKMCSELNDVFGYREAFNCHRRAILQYIVNISTNAYKMQLDQLLLLPCTTVPVTVPTWDRQISQLLKIVLNAEAQISELHGKWCRLFLGYYRSSNDNSEIVL